MKHAALVTMVIMLEDEMKKALLVALIGLAATSHAEIDVLWNSAFGCYFSPIGTPGAAGLGILGPDGSGNSTVAQLVSTGANGTRDWAGLGLTNFWMDSAATVTGDDVVLQSIIISENGLVDGDINLDTYGYFRTQHYSAEFAAGSVYARIFQDAAPEQGDWYRFSEVITLEDITGIGFPQDIDLSNNNWVSINTDAVDPPLGSIGNAQVVPEPATALSLLLGGLIITGYRRLRKSYGHL